jgi:hypothetical protein
MEPPITQAVALSPTQLILIKTSKKRRPDGDRPKPRYSFPKNLDKKETDRFATLDN